MARERGPTPMSASSGPLALPGRPPRRHCPRPAAFRAVGLLPEAAWEALVAGYRSGPGDALPATGPVWDAVDLAARWAVVVAAAGLLRDGTDALGGAGHETLTAFIEACHSMQSE